VGSRPGKNIYIAVVSRIGKQAKGDPPFEVQQRLILQIWVVTHFAFSFFSKKEEV
jgi:hypothetical protein